MSGQTSKLCLTTLVINTSLFRQQRRVFCKGLTNQELVKAPLITSSYPSADRRRSVIKNCILTDYLF